MIRVGKQKSLLGVVVAELKVDFLGLFEEPAVEVLLVVHLVEIKGVLFVFEVRGLIFYLGLLVVLGLESPLALRPGLAIWSEVFLFSISLHINFREAFVLVIEIYGVLDILVADGKGIVLVILAEGALLGVEYILDGLVFEGWQFLDAGGLLGLELDLLDEWEEVEVLGTHEFLGLQFFHAGLKRIEESGN